LKTETSYLVVEKLV